MINRLQSLFASKGMGGRVLRGGALLGMGSIGEQGLRFLRGMILTRLLAPKEFGLMAIVLSVSYFLQVITGIGVKESIVQSPHGTERTYLNGAFWLAFLRGCGLYLIAFIAAPWVADYYDRPQLTALLRVSFLQLIAQGGISMGAYVAVKEMRFKPWVIVQNGGNAIGILTAIILGWKIQGVWALVIGFVTEGVARCILSYAICPFRPRWQFDREHLRSLFDFTRQMLGLPLLMYLYTDGAMLIAGKYFPSHQLGIFSMALTLARIPSTFANLMVDLLMPAFSEIQKHPERVNQGLLKITTAILIMAIPGWFFLLVYGKQVLTLVYGPAYAWANHILVILFANEMLRTCSVPLATVYMAVGQPALLRKFSVIRATTVLLLLIPLIVLKMEIVAMAAIPLVAMASSYGMQLSNIRGVTGLPVSNYMGTVARCLLFSVPAGLFWLAIEPVFRSTNPMNTMMGVTFASLAFAAIAAGVIGKNAQARNYVVSLVRTKR